MAMWERNRYTGQWDGIENPEIDPNKCNQLILEKDTSTMRYYYTLIKIPKIKRVIDTKC